MTPEPLWLPIAVGVFVAGMALFSVAYGIREYIRRDMRAHWTAHVAFILPLIAIAGYIATHR